MNILRVGLRLRGRFSSVKDKIKKEREIRLKKEGEVLTLNTSEELESIRNIAIIAHIDAGKTTTTERMLYYAGALIEPGNVDEGNTTMDYLPQERARGITIRSAAISFGWKGYQINVIDTPGHVDFSGEVARSVRVLDGVVTIFDAVNGVQTQTEKVWTQANERNLPKLCFTNKMDRLGASLDLTYKSIKERLNAQPFVLQYPLGEDEHFRGVIDLVNMTTIEFEGYKGQEVQEKPVSKEDPNYNRYLKAREELIDKVAGFDEKLADLYLNGTAIKPKALQEAIKRVLSDPRYINKTCGLLMGTAFKYKGVQPLLDAIINYLPSPTQMPPIACLQNPKDVRKPLKTEKFCGYIFKNIYDTEKGPLSYVRVYSGTLHKSTSLLNTTKNVYERIQFLYRVRADKYVPVTEVFAGDIIAVNGLKQSGAGDTLINVNEPRFILEKLSLPSAIFKAPFEAASLSEQSKLEQQLRKIGSEDNSLLIENDPQTRQLVVSGLGELHLEIVRDRLLDMGINVKMGNLRIGYMESFADKVRKTFRMKKLVSKDEQDFELTLEIVPLRDQNDRFQQRSDVVIGFDRTQEFDIFWKEFMRRKEVKTKPVNKTANEDDPEPVKTDVEAVIFGKSLRNPIKPYNIHEEVSNPNGEDDIPDPEEETSEQEQQKPFNVMHHISCLPFDVLDSLVDSIKLSLLSGKYSFPITSCEVRILDGKFPPNRASKMVVNQTAVKIMNDLIEQNSVLIEPMVEVELIGEEVTIESVCGTIMRKRGRIEERQERRVKAVVPAEGVRGWVKDIRALGFDTQIKFSGYQQVQGTDPQALARSN